MIGQKYTFTQKSRVSVKVWSFACLFLSAGISLKTWPCSRKSLTGRRASQTGINSTSAMHVLLADVAVNQQPDFF